MATWVIAGLALLLIAGWALAFHNLSVSQHNATTLKQANDVTRDRATLQANQSALETSVKRQATDLQRREDAVKKREVAITEQEKIAAQNTITEGNWAVGDDIQPGTYRTIGDVAGVARRAPGAARAVFGRETENFR